MRRWLSMTAADLGRGIGEAKIDPVRCARPILTRLTATPAAGPYLCPLTADRGADEAGLRGGVAARAGQASCQLLAMVCRSAGRDLF